MWDFKQSQTKLPVFKQELAEDGGASFSASYVKTLRGKNSPVEALFAKLIIKDQLLMALIDSGSIVNLLSETLYQQLGEASQTHSVQQKFNSCQQWENACKGVSSYSTRL